MQIFILDKDTVARLEDRKKVFRRKVALLLAFAVVVLIKSRSIEPCDVVGYLDECS